ncbi:MAG: DUF2490 domain-containing protein [Proteobacteria bacterium]|nr:MAG: DUF2490 domain-containing protein [Pseudomonadota bacterium]
MIGLLSRLDSLSRPRRSLFAWAILSLLGMRDSFASPIYWYQSSATLGLTENWALYGEIQPRFIESMRQSQSMNLRAALLYRMDPEWSFGLGYGWMPQYLPTYRNEGRIYQQLEWKPKTETAPFDFSFRGRLEERRLQDISPLMIRVRSRAQANYSPEGSQFGVYVWDELFIALNDGSNSIQSGFDQNRLSAGFRIKNENTTFEAGPLSQRLRGGIWNHGGVLNLVLSWW